MSTHFFLSLSTISAPYAAWISIQFGCLFIYTLFSLLWLAGWLTALLCGCGVRCQEIMHETERVENNWMTLLNRLRFATLFSHERLFGEFFVEIFTFEF
jgi:hypothetical protein